MSEIVADLLQLVVLARLLQVVLQLERAVEVVLDRALAPAGDDEDVVDARPDGLLDHVLDGRLVDDREHLLGLGLRRGEEPRPQPGRGDDRLLDLHATLHRLRMPPAVADVGSLPPMPNARRRCRGPGAYDAAPMGSTGIRIAAEKAELRARMKAARAARSTEERAAAAAAVEAALFELPELNGAGTVLAFASFGSEMPTAAILARLAGEGRRVLVPFLVEGAMEAAPAGGPTVATSYGAREPADRAAGIRRRSTRCWFRGWRSTVPAGGSGTGARTSTATYDGSRRPRRGSRSGSRCSSSSGFRWPNGTNASTSWSPRPA